MRVDRVAAPWQGHSRKPEIFADMITAYYPTAPKLELFYRAFSPGAGAGIVPRTATFRISWR